MAEQVEQVVYEISAEDAARLERIFTYQAPKLDQIPRYEILRGEAKKFAYILLMNCPPSRERSLAITHLEECVMQANAAIARNEV